LSGCPETPPNEPPTPAAEVEEPVFSGTFEVPSRADFANPSLPVGPEGYGYTMVALPGTIQLWHDNTARTPFTAAGECLALVAQCLEPEVRNVRGCFENAPVCSTDAPWEPPDESFCCPSGCANRYVELRAAGLTVPKATSGALLNEGSCMPGLDAWRKQR